MDVTKHFAKLDEMGALIDGGPYPKSAKIMNVISVLLVEVVKDQERRLREQELRLQALVQTMVK